MRPIRKRFWLAQLLLPAILFRALIPVGFMPAIDGDGRFGVIFCPVSTGATHSHHHDHAGGAAGSAGSGHHQLVCPFAASTGLAPLPDFVVPAPAPAESVAPAVGAGERLFVPTILRAQSPRAPPGVA